MFFFDKRVRSFMSRTAITLKFKMRWFPDEAGYSADYKMFKQATGTIILLVYVGAIVI